MILSPFMDPFHLPSLTFCNLLGDVLYLPLGLLRFTQKILPLPLDFIEL